jgi:hypothetical protein
LHERFADALEQRRGPEVDSAANEINSFVTNLRSELSPAFRAVVPYYPLSCC